MGREGLLDGRRRDVVVIGTSAGGVEALRQVASGLPAEFDHCPRAILTAIPLRDGPVPAGVAIYAQDVDAAAPP